MPFLSQFLFEETFYRRYLNRITTGTNFHWMKRNIFKYRRFKSRMISEEPLFWHSPYGSHSSVFWKPSSLIILCSQIKHRFGGVESFEVHDKTYLASAFYSFERCPTIFQQIVRKLSALEQGHLCTNCRGMDFPVKKLSSVYFQAHRFYYLQ